MSEKNILLIHPPYGDFTYPYHSLSYVAPPLKAAGYNVDVIDLNIEWFRHLFTEERIHAWREDFVRQLRSFEQKPHWSIGEQEEAIKLVQAIAVCDYLEPRDTIDIFKSERFYDYDSYLKARNNVRQFERLLSHVYTTYDFYTAFAVPIYEPNAETLVEKALASEAFIKDTCEILQSRFGDKEYLFCGFSGPFSGNLRLGFAALEAVRRVFPTARRVAGGTAVSDIYKNKTSIDVLSPFRQVCDHFIVGEGDEVVNLYADWCAGKISSEELPAQVIDLNNLNVSKSHIQPKYVQIQEKSLSPDYSWINWDLYLSPEKQVNYSPSRGCFWNKCTFCDYGLNDDAPTAPSRTMSASVVSQHLREILAQGIRHVYFAVDAITPVFLSNLADELLAEQIDISWSGEFFLTKQFNPKMVEKLERSGLVTASFGLESGSSRVLSMMGKGQRRVEDVLVPAFEAFRDSAIGLQPKYFFGFPGETEMERQSTVELLTKNRDIFAIVTDWNVFDLSPGAEVAKFPDKFGVGNIRRKPGDNIGGGLEYSLSDGAEPPGPTSFAYFNDQLKYFHTFERPWVGGIDAFHSKLYLQRFGKRIFHELPHRYTDRDDLTRPWNIVEVESNFDIEAAFDNVLMYSASQTACFYKKLQDEMGEDLEAALEEVQIPLTRNEQRSSYTVRFR